MKASLAKELKKLNTPVLDKIDLEIVKRNTAFAKASKAQKRVLIAKDVLAQIKAKRIVATHGSWINVYEQKPEVSDDLRSAILKDEVTCDCCALGAMMTCSVMIKNDVSVYKAGNLDGADAIGGYDASGLSNYFDSKQLSMIEYAFEGGKGIVYPGNRYGITRTLANKIDRHMDRDWNRPDERLKFIMRNIIRNKGTFKV